jgi:hypothetical protein
MAHGFRVHRWFTILAAVLITVLGISLTASVKAHQSQDATPIAIGDTVEGTISGSNFQSLYLLTVADNTSVVITMRGGGGLDAYLILKDEDDKVLAEDDDSGGAADAQIKHTFPKAGDFIIVAMRSGGQSGRTEGTFELTVDTGTGSGGGSAATKPATARATAVAQAATATTVATTAATSAATEAPTEEATEAPTDEPTTAPPTRTRAPRPTQTPADTEEPTEESTPDDQPTQRPTRTPRPTLTRRPPTMTPTPSPFVEGGTVTDGATVKGEIDDQRVAYYYIYEGTAGEQLTITADTEEDLQVRLIVAAIEAQVPLKVVESRVGVKKVVLEATLPTDDNYVIFIVRFNGVEGTTAGPFTMTLNVTTFPAEVDVTGTAKAVVDRLRNENLVPEGGKQLFLVNTTLRDVRVPGRNLPIGNRVTARDFVMHFELRWPTMGDTSACAVKIRKSGSRDETTIALTNDKKFILIQRQGNRALINYAQETDVFEPKAPTTVTIIAIQDKVTVYVNGRIQTRETGKNISGSFEVNLFNTEGNKINSTCSYRGWVWSFDK